VGFRKGKLLDKKILEEERACSKAVELLLHEKKREGEGNVSKSLVARENGEQNWRLSAVKKGRSYLREGWCE